MPSFEQVRQKAAPEVTNGARLGGLAGPRQLLRRSERLGSQV
jgi:hypothetical protein